jgi:hypothetical protein
MFIQKAAQCVIAHQYTSTTFVSLCCQSSKEKFVPLFKKCFFSKCLSFCFNCEYLELRNLKLRRVWEFLYYVAVLSVCLLCQHRIINTRMFCFVTTLRYKYHIICSVHCDHNQPHTPIQAQSLYQINKSSTYTTHTDSFASYGDKSPSSGRYNARAHETKTANFHKQS